MENLDLQIILLNSMPMEVFGQNSKNEKIWKFVMRRNIDLMCIQNMYMKLAGFLVIVLMSTTRSL